MLTILSQHHSDTIAGQCLLVGPCSCTRDDTIPLAQVPALTKHRHPEEGARLIVPFAAKGSKRLEPGGVHNLCILRVLVLRSVPL